MLRCIAIFLILSFAAQTFSKAFVVIDYYTNKAVYEKSCINKMRPMMHCNGKCQMMKKLREQEKKEQQNERNGNFRFEVLSATSYFTLIFNAPLHMHEANFPVLSLGHIVDRSYGIFRPPALL
jgi:hypothetical protein